MSEKNKIIQIRITDINPDGNGVGRTDLGRVVFVPLTVPGDFCKVRIIKDNNNVLIGRPEQIIEPSPDRIVPECAVFNKCGGCSYGHISYEKEKQLKEETVRNAFKRIAGMEIKLNPLISVNSARYRNKVQYPVSTENGSLVFGYYARHSHRVVTHTSCLLQDDVFYNIAKDLVGIFNEMRFSSYDEESGKGLIRHIYLRKTRAGDVAVCVIINGDVLPGAESVSKKITEKHPQVKSFFVNVNKKHSNVILGEKNILISGQPFLTDMLCGKSFTLSPSSFFQVNSEAAEVLYNKAGEYAALAEGDILLDLYCGTGTIGLCIAGDSNPLCGVELVRDAVENAKKNAVINGRNPENTLFVCADAKDGIDECKKHIGKPNVIVVDPPRKGLDSSLIDEITKAAPERVVYISCNPATLARDAAIFCERGYVTIEATPVDLFPRTGHVECVILMQRSGIEDKK
ncbi:MAG: 23S rRNA (uracil(1939)-C(5))-methyltransferase RlmD [Eubacteriales bacterium]|nr:23S rRNA (uracil(1939)-C(5))-methyltransferase RlmD [Eubacteriales bacterium]